MIRDRKEARLPEQILNDDSSPWVADCIEEAVVDGPGQQAWS